MLNLVVLGDSIAKGYGSSEALSGGFGTVLGQKLSADVTNLGIVGLDSNQLLNKLSDEKFVDAVENADVICISIGSNDLLKPFLSIFADTLGVQGEEKELFAKIQDKMSSSAKKNPLEAANMLSTAMKKLTNNSELNSACESFPDRFDKIILRINELNPEAVIYVNNIYNPYYGVAYQYEGISVFNVQQLCEPYIKKLNTTFKSNENYTVIDMYSVFRQTGLTNVNAASITNMKGINLDPHPNDDGYRLMADYIYTHLDSIVPVVSEAVFEPEENGGMIKVNFSESVRLIAGKKLFLKSDDKKDTFVYDIKEEQKVDSEGYLLEIGTDSFVPGKNNKNDKLQAGESYILSAEDGAIKDNGNNHLEEEMMKFTMPGEKQEISAQQTVSSDVINMKSDYMNVIFSGLFLIVLVVVFIVFLRKKITGREKDK